MNIGMNIRLMREKAGIQQAELAARVGVTQSMICQIERGTKACSMQLGADIAAALGCSISDLYDAANGMAIAADTYREEHPTTDDQRSA